MKRKGQVVRNGAGPRPEAEDTVKEQDDLSSASSVSLNSLDDGGREADLLKKKCVLTTHTATS